MLVLKAELMGIYKSNDFTDKNTGVITIGKTKLQLLSKQVMKNGSTKITLLDVSIPNEKVNLFTKDRIGKIVEVDVAVIGDVKYYGV
ncbi:hypothetical protein [Poseidonibacter antarcticus]|uniref:hypothetical protein n=1 Tax=Poseidonibacter antarcticus TaxID=2478538 RepID=UPI000EF4F372|nr:hypothetical protein [Poseidonibacter antarcticus]